MKSFVQWILCAISVLGSGAHYPAWQDEYWRSKGYWPWEVKTHREHWGNAWSAPSYTHHILEPTNNLVAVYPPPAPALPERIKWTFECEDSSTQAYHVDSGLCLQLSHQGPPCGEMTVFVRNGRNPLFGECQCVRPASTCGRPLSLWPDHVRCYELYTQGPCEPDEWLVPVRSVTSACEKNPCMDLKADTSSRDNPVFTFSMNGQCFSTETQAFCPENQVARFLDRNGGPGCYEKEANNCFHTVLNPRARLLAVQEKSQQYIAQQQQVVVPVPTLLTTTTVEPPTESTTLLSEN